MNRVAKSEVGEKVFVMDQLDGEIVKLRRSH